MRPKATPYALVAVDRGAYRRYSLGLSRAVEVENAPLWGALIAEAAHTIAREWTRRYGVPFPTGRVDWRIEHDNEDENLRRLAAAQTVHE